MKKKSTIFLNDFSEEILVEIICALNSYENSVLIIAPPKEISISSESFQENLYDWEMSLYEWIEMDYITPSPFDFLRIVRTKNGLTLKVNCRNNKPYKLSNTTENYYSGVYIKDKVKVINRHATTEEILSMKQFKLWIEKSKGNNQMKYTFFNKS